MSGKPSVLVVEDDENLRVTLQDNLEEEGYAVTTASTVAAGWRQLEPGAVDVVVLDLMLPDGDGYSLCRKLRAAGLSTRVLMLTARSLEEDLVRGFESGADDYLAKPYRLRELLARVGALARRSAAPAAQVVAFAGYRLDLSARALADTRGRPVDLTRTEMDLLALLLRSRDRALSRDEILDQVWGKEVVVDAHTVDNFVSSLKKKLSWSERSAFRIKTVRGVGYRMEVDD
ncbi:MAG: response regulator transcription factor [Myxococcaceae bacterium]